MSQIRFKAGATFLFAGTVTGLPTGYAWTAAACVRDAGFVQICALTVTLAQASDYSTSGNWVITLFASSTVTASWLDATRPFLTTTLYADIVYSVAGEADPVVPSDTFTLVVSPMLTGA